MILDDSERPAAEYEALADALEALREEVATEELRDSRLEGLFDEATTSNPSIWNTVTAFIDVEDGEAVVTEESKLAQGSWAPEIVDGCDAMSNGSPMYHTTNRLQRPRRDRTRSETNRHTDRPTARVERVTPNRPTTRVERVTPDRRKATRGATRSANRASIVQEVNR